MKQLLLRGLSKIWRVENGRIIATVLLTIFALLSNFPDLPPFKPARLALFDQYQRLFPRQPQSSPAVIVAIDEETLAALGQWPWPRNYLAALIDAIAAMKPAAIGLDIIMPEHDRASPEAVSESRSDLPEAVLKALANIKSNDDLLAQSLANAPTVLGAAGFKFKTFETLEGLRVTNIAVHGHDPLNHLNTYPYVLASLPDFQAKAHGQAFLSNEPDNDGIVRRIAMLSNLNNLIVPGLSLEMLRVAQAAPQITVNAGIQGVESVTLGNQHIPLQSDGEIWIHFSKISERNFISAYNLLKNEVPKERIAGKLVLLGLTGVGLQDLVTTPFGDRRPGVEVHAQLLESFADGRFLTRPWWLHRIELLVLIIGGAILIWFIPDTKSFFAQQRNIKHKNSASNKTQEGESVDHTSGIAPKFLLILFFLQFILLFGTGIALFRWAGLLFDAASLFIMLSVVFGSLLFSVFIESDHLRKNMEIALQNQRVEAAKLAGELETARRIQLGTLPVASRVFPKESRFEIAAMLEPARQVGGDLYDFFMIDKQRVFFIIGDVSGKGLPASLLMVVTKALGKSVALRGNAEIGSIVNMTNTEIARENPEMLFVTAVAGILDIETGAVEFVNAGHDAPLLIKATGGFESITGQGGPPLCALDDFIYPVEYLQLGKGDMLVLLTDGITEAMNINKELYGMERVRTVLNNLTLGQHPDKVLTALREDVRVFVDSAEPSDDLTLLVLRWLGSK